MKAALIVIGLSVLAVFVSSIFLFAKEQAGSTFLQLVGAGALVVVVLTHIAEAFDLFPWMGWGLPHSAGHYIDLISAASGITLYTAGCLSRVVARRRNSS
jgi:hypothetical protein